MPELIDQYFLVNRRDTAFFNKFLDHYLPGRTSLTEDLQAVLCYHEQHPHKANIVYIENWDKGSMITHAILSWTDDAKLMLGISAAGTIWVWRRITNYTRK